MGELSDYYFTLFSSEALCGLYQVGGWIEQSPQFVFGRILGATVITQMGRQAGMHLEQLAAPLSNPHFGAFIPLLPLLCDLDHYRTTSAGAVAGFVDPCNDIGITWCIRAWLFLGLGVSLITA